jgi:1,4-alpha-glucan branching enzyme
VEVSVPSDHDVYLFHEGNLFHSYKMMGAHIVEKDGQKGVMFSVWAPYAKRMSVVGDFNHWNGNSHPMKRVEQSGIWTLFIPNLQDGEIYKYEIHTPNGEILLKADPYAFYSELRPNTASVVCSLEGYKWNDSKWFTKKKKKDSYHQPMLIYEVHLGSWKKKPDGSFYTYRELADELVDYVAGLGYTHIEILPILEHPFDRSWGYQVTGYYSVTSRYGTPQDFMYFVDKCHEKEIGVILDWVPAHFCKDAHGLGKFDGTPLYEPTDERMAERVIWGTYSFDYSKPEVVSFLISNALFWMDVYHIDGLRVDAVSSMIYLNHEANHQLDVKNQFGGFENLEAIEFIKKINKAVFSQYPEALMIAEESTAWPNVSAPVDVGGLGFNYKWNMGWMNDMLQYMEIDTSQRSSHQNLVTFSFLYTFSENYILPLSHDEVVHSKRSLLNKYPGDYWRKFANLRALYGFMIAHPGKKLLFMGGEFGQYDEWKDLTELDWVLLDYDMHKKMFDYVKELNHLYKETRSLWRLDHEPGGFEWINADDQSQSVLSFMRKGKRKGDYCIIVCNFSAEVYHDYRIGVPSQGFYEELFNSDAERFGGSEQLNENKIKVEKEPYHNQPYSASIKVPPLGVTILRKVTRASKKRIRKEST